MALPTGDISVGGDQRIVVLADGLSQAGIPAELCRTVACGYIHGLWRLVWTSYNELVGDAAELEAKLGWRGPSRGLVNLLKKAGLVIEDHGYLIDVLAFREAPAYLRKRWRRYSPITYDTAAKRAERPEPKVVPLTAVVPLVEASKPDEPVVNLFGEAVPEVVKHGNSRSTRTAAHAPGHQELIAFWSEQWTAKYGCKYPFRPVDAKHIKTILTTCAGFEHCQSTLVSFLGDDDKFIKGHSLNRLICNLARYASGQSGRGAGEFAEPERELKAIDPDAFIEPADDDTGL